MLTPPSGGILKAQEWEGAIIGHERRIKGSTRSTGRSSPRLAIRLDTRWRRHDGRHGIDDERRYDGRWLLRRAPHAAVLGTRHSPYRCPGTVDLSPGPAPLDIMMPRRAFR